MEVATGEGPRGTLRPPTWLDKLARRMWGELIPLLQSMGVLTRIDRNSLIRYCTYWSRWVKAEQWLAKHGTSYPIRDGNGKTKSIGQFPQVSEASKLGMLLARLEQEFGMTPSARSRIECDVEEAGAESIEEYLKSRMFEEKYFGKHVNGTSAEEVLDLMEKTAGPPVLKIDRREFGPDGKQLQTGSESED
jgi:P27 family predicted phage terminase small subunit